MESYQEMQNRHQQEVNAFPMKWAFSNEQFDRAMRELGLDPSQTDLVIGIGGGGFIRKSDKQAFIDLFKRHEQERKAALAEEKAGAEHAYQMFLYELGNHEYVITQDLSETLDACGLSIDEINSNPHLLKALKRAIHDYMKDAEA